MKDPQQVRHGEPVHGLSTRKRCRQCGVIFATPDLRRTLCSEECARNAYLIGNRNRQTRYRGISPDKVNARQALKNAVLLGKVRRPPRCEQCGAATKIEGHHEDYSRPFYVEWLCRKCHSLADKRLRSAS